MMDTRSIRGLAVALALVVAGCSSQEPEPAPQTDMEEPADTPELTPAAPAPDPAPAPAAEAPANVIAPPPEEPIAPDAQMLDDADATGMTARLSRDEAADTGDAAPAETERQQ